MTDWRILLVDEELRDLVNKIFGDERPEEKSIWSLECTFNPFNKEEIEDWPELIRRSPHKAIFTSKGGREITVKFWVKYNSAYGEPYENPLVIDEERIMIVVDRR